MGVRGETVEELWMPPLPPLHEALSTSTSSRATTRDPAARRATHWMPLRAGHGAQGQRDGMADLHGALRVLDPAAGRGMTGEEAGAEIWR